MFFLSDSVDDRRVKWEYVGFIDRVKGVNESFHIIFSRVKHQKIKILNKIPYDKSRKGQSSPHKVQILLQNIFLLL